MYIFSFSSKYALLCHHHRLHKKHEFPQELIDQKMKEYKASSDAAGVNGISPTTTTSSNPGDNEDVYTKIANLHYPGKHVPSDFLTQVRPFIHFLKEGEAISGKVHTDESCTVSCLYYVVKCLLYVLYICLCSIDKMIFTGTPIQSEEHLRGVQTTLKYVWGLLSLLDPNKEDGKCNWEDFASLNKMKNVIKAIQVRQSVRKTSGTIYISFVYYSMENNMPCFIVMKCCNII